MRIAAPLWPHTERGARTLHCRRLSVEFEYFSSRMLRTRPSGKILDQRHGSTWYTRHITIQCICNSGSSLTSLGHDFIMSSYSRAIRRTGRPPLIIFCLMRPYSHVFSVSTSFDLRQGCYRMPIQPKSPS